ncbi:MAG: hypothetical protein WCS70_09915 [Verrucomicrobiota bacterium]
MKIAASWRWGWAALLCLATAVLPVAHAQVLSASNGFYTVFVSTGANAGQYTIATGPQHPSGAGLNVLFGNGTPGTSYNTIRSFSSGTDYVQRTTPLGTLLGPFGVVTPIGTIGYRTTYTLPGPPVTPDKLVIIQDLKINGSNFSNSTVEITTTILNSNATSTAIGVRYLLDTQVGADDGPTFQAVSPSGPTRTTETEFNLPTFTAFRIQDNDSNPSVPLFNVFGTVTGPATVIPNPSHPTLLQYVGWSAAQNNPFNYSTGSGTSVAVAGGINDSAVLYFFGNSDANALVMPAGGSRKVSASLFLTQPGFVFDSSQSLECHAEIPVPQPSHLTCITRPARFWFEHPLGQAENCVSLLKFLQANGEGIQLGFICLPVSFENGDDLADGQDAVIEALGLYYRSTKLTGENNGTQSAKLAGSKLCRARKQMAAEFVAATANVVLLGTDPGNCGYVSGGVSVTFATNLLDQAGAVIASEDLDAVRSMTAVLRKFNSLGQTNAFPGELVECSPESRTTLKTVSRDPTTSSSCPGINTSCSSAQSLISFPYNQSADLTKYSDSFPGPTCGGGGGANAVWKITPPTAAPGRNFVIQTDGSNIPTLISVWQGTSCDELTQIACATGPSDLPSNASVQFTADGTNSYYIVVEGNAGEIGKLKLNFTSF